MDNYLVLMSGSDSLRKSRFVEEKLKSLDNPFLDIVYWNEWDSSGASLKPFFYASKLLWIKEVPEVELPNLYTELINDANENNFIVIDSNSKPKNITCISFDALSENEKYYEIRTWNATKRLVINEKGSDLKRARRLLAKHLPDLQQPLELELTRLSLISLKWSYISLKSYIEEEGFMLKVIYDYLVSPIDNKFKLLKIYSDKGEMVKALFLKELENYSSFLIKGEDSELSEYKREKYKFLTKSKAYQRVFNFSRMWLEGLSFEEILLL